MQSSSRAKNHGRNAALIAAAAVAAGVVLAAAPASAAASVTKPFALAPYGASTFAGTITWYNRSVKINGTLKAVNCRQIRAEAWAGINPQGTGFSGTQCNSTTPQPIGLSANVPGGADHVEITMYDGDGGYLVGGTFYRR
jgi:hypothetical protein